MPLMPSTGGRTRQRKVAIAVRKWAAEESVAVWNWASKFFINQVLCPEAC
jgi:hypothetical protein